MHDDTTRRRLLAVGGLGALAGLGGCLRLTSGDDEAADTTTADDAAGTEPSSTDTSEGPDADSGDDGPETRAISGPSTVEHTFVDAQNRMAQPSATAPASSPIIDWEADEDAALGSRRFSSPLVTTDAIVVSNFRDTTAYSRADGSVRWRLSDSALDDYALSTVPDLHEDAIVFAATNKRTGDWELVAIEAGDGTERWAVTLPTAAEENVRSTIVDGTRGVVVTGTLDDADSQYADVVDVDLETQSIRAESRLAAGALAPEDLALDGDTLLVTTDEAASGMDNVVAFDLGDMERRWSKALPIGESYPMLDDDTVYLCTETDVSNAAVRALDLSDGSKRWRFELRDAPRAGVTVAHDRVYAVTDNKLYALEANEGTAAWSYSPEKAPRIQGNPSALPVATSDHLLLGCGFADDDAGAVRAVTRAEGELAWRTDVPYREAYSPFVADDHLYTVGYDPKEDVGTIYALH